MAFTLKLDGDYLKPAILCDRCGLAVSSSGYQLSRPISTSHPLTASSAQVCGDDCLDAWTLERDDDGEWIAIALDAYLANLVATLEIDLEGVLERERAVSAAEHTRHEAPD